MSDDRKKVLVIGAGIGQIPLIEKAKKRGYHVCVASIPGNYPGFDIADSSWFIDIYDRDGVLKRAKEENIVAVISDQNDLMMPTVAYVAEHMHLPGNSFDTVNHYCNKSTYRTSCEEIGIPVPKHIVLSSPDDIDSFSGELPWIVKPVDSQSSIGVQKIEKKDEAKEAIKLALSKSNSEKAILEEFFEGREVVCEGFINDGHYYLLSFADRKYFDLDELMIPCQTIFPSTLDSMYKDRIVDYETRMAKYTKACFGIVHSEWLINEEKGTMIPVESALRGGGVYISSHLIPLCTGIDINEVLLDKALGLEVNMDSLFLNKKDKASAYICFYLPEGTVKKVQGIETLQCWDSIHKIAVDVKPGDVTKKMTFKGQRLGPIIVSADDRRLLEERIDMIQSILQIDVENNKKEVHGIIWA